MNDRPESAAPSPRTPRPRRIWPWVAAGVLLGTLAAVPETRRPIHVVDFIAAGPKEAEVAATIASITENASSQLAMSYEAELPDPLKILLVRQPGDREVQLIARGSGEAAGLFAEQAALIANPMPAAPPPPAPAAAPPPDPRVVAMRSVVENLRPRAASDPAARDVVLFLEREIQAIPTAAPLPPPPPPVVTTAPPETAVVIDVRPAPFWNLFTIAQFSVAGAMSALALLLVIQTFRLFTASEVS